MNGDEHCNKEVKQDLIRVYFSTFDVMSDVSAKPLTNGATVFPEPLAQSALDLTEIQVPWRWYLTLLMYPVKKSFT